MCVRRSTAITSYTDVDAFNSTANTVTLTVNTGTLDVQSGSRPAGYIWTAGTHTLVLTGTKAQLDTALANLYYTGATDYNGDDVLTVTVGDGGKNGADGTDNSGGGSNTSVSEHRDPGMTHRP